MNIASNWPTKHRIQSNIWYIYIMNQWWTKQNTVINSDIDGISKQTSNRKNNRETNHLFNQQTNQPADQQTPQLTSAGQQTSKHACICTHFGIIASIFDSLHGFADWGWQALYDRKRDNDLMVCICLYVMQEGECVVCVCVSPHVRVWNIYKEHVELLRVANPPIRNCPVRECGAHIKKGAWWTHCILTPGMLKIVVASIFFQVLIAFHDGRFPPGDVKAWSVRPLCVCDCVCVRACAFPWFWKGCSEVTAWFGNYEVRIGHWEQRIWKLFGVQVPRNIISPTPPHLKRSIMSVFKCQGTLLAHPTSPHVPSCWCASAKEPHPTPAHRTSIPCTTSKYTIAKIDNPSRAASQPIATKKHK